MKSKLIKIVATIIVIASLCAAGYLYFKRPVQVEYLKPEPKEAKIEDVINQRADAWLKSPEAFEYAKTKATTQLIDELGKK